MNRSQFEHWMSGAKQKNVLVMGVLNVTPDSFSDGGRYHSTEKAVAHGLGLIHQGADILDIGGESTKPYAKTISLDEELQRVIPVIERIAQQTDVCISIDTYKPQIMAEAVKAGACIINDVYALRQEGALETAVHLNVPICLMHMQGEPKNMQDNPCYPRGVVAEVGEFLEQRVQACIDAGIKPHQLLIDPGFGFGKSVSDNLHILNALEQFHDLKHPIVLGVSRKSTIGAILNQDVDNRLAGGLAMSVYAALKGVALLRTHDVAQTKQALTVLEAIERN